MKRLILAGSVALAACSSQSRPASTREPLGGGQVVLATFTADVDPVAGTFVVRSAPTAEGRALQVLDGDVIVANKMAGDPLVPVTFFNADQGVGRACTDTDPVHSGKVWGATVTITSRLTDAALGGVYAEITSATPVTTLQSCSSVAAPPGLSATPGLWAYPNIAAGGTQEQDWVFKYETASRFSFAGRIVGVKISKGDWAGSPAVQRPVNNSWSAGTGIVDTGTHLAVASNPASAPYGIDFVDEATGEHVRNVTVPLRVNAMAVAGDRIWIGTESDGTTSYVGYVSKDGTGVATLEGTGQNRIVLAIVADPTTPDAKAWVLWNNQGNTYYVAPYEPGGGLGAVASSEGLAYSMVTGEDGRLFVANFSTGWIDIFTMGATAIHDESYPGGSCFSPWMIASGPGGALYFNAAEGCVCSYSPDGTVYEDRGCIAGETPRGLAVGSTGRVWVTTGSDGHLWELDGSGVTNNNMLLAAGTQLWPLAVDALGSLWYADAAGLWKVSP